MRRSLNPTRWDLPAGGFNQWAASVTGPSEDDARCTGADIGRQLHADLIGKDSHRGITLSYAWLANQFGHFSLGFIPTILLILLCYGRQHGLQAALIVTCLWTAFEILNFLGPLLFEARRTMVAPAWRNIAYDTVTDVLYFALGAFVAAAVFDGPVPGAVSICLALILAPLSRHWYKTKMYLQRAGFPVQVRLSQWPGYLDAAALDRVADLASGRGAGQHLLITGERGAGASGLGIAIATERAIRHRSCAYMSAVRLVDVLTAGPAEYDGAWSWRRVSTLVVDELGSAGRAAPGIGPEAIATLLAGSAGQFRNRAAVRSRTVIWVLGADPDGTRREAWTVMLTALGVMPGRIYAVGASAMQPASVKNVIVVGEGHEVGQALHSEALV